jgi:hypothetical protein
MKIIIEIELNELEARQIKVNSIERVMNNAIRVGSAGSHELKKGSERECASILFEDCCDLKQITTKLWNYARNAIFIHDSKEMKSG